MRAPAAVAAARTSCVLQQPAPADRQRAAQRQCCGGLGTCVQLTVSSCKAAAHLPRRAVGQVRASLPVTPPMMRHWCRHSCRQRQRPCSQGGRPGSDKRTRGAVQQHAARGLQVEPFEGRRACQGPLHGALQAQLDVRQASNVLPGHCRQAHTLVRPEPDRWCRQHTCCMGDPPAGGQSGGNVCGTAAALCTKLWAGLLWVSPCKPAPRAAHRPAPGRISGSAPRAMDGGTALRAAWKSATVTWCTGRAAPVSPAQQQQQHGGRSSIRVDSSIQPPIALKGGTIRRPAQHQMCCTMHRGQGLQPCSESAGQRHHPGAGWPPTSSTCLLRGCAGRQGPQRRLAAQGGQVRPRVAVRGAGQLAQAHVCSQGQPCRMQRQDGCPVLQARPAG